MVHLEIHTTPKFSYPCVLLSSLNTPQPGVALAHDADRFRQEIYLRGINLEFKIIKPADIVKSVQATTAALYKDWRGIKAQSRLSNFLSSANVRWEKKMGKEKEE